MEKRLQDGDNFNDAVETIPRRIKTYRCSMNQPKQVEKQKFTNINPTIFTADQNYHFRETTYPVIDAHAGVCKKVKFKKLIFYSFSNNLDDITFAETSVPSPKSQQMCYTPNSSKSAILQVSANVLSSTKVPALDLLPPECHVPLSTRLIF